jgi:TonB family protein
MNASAAKSGGWSRARFLTVVTVLFATQAGLVLLFAERPRPPSAPPVVRTVFRWLGGDLDESALSKYIFASDPTIFPSSSSHGFADQAWLRLAPVEYNKTTNDSEAPSFLEFAANPLRGSARPPEPDGDGIPFDLTVELAMSKEPAPTYTAADGSRPASFVRIDGPLAGHRIDAAVPLREWGSSVVLSNTVVRFGVNRSGEVVSAVLWSGSGSAEADASAVDSVNAMRFTPAPRSPDEFTWDRATFYWRTVAPPPGTNAPGTPQFP